MRAIIKYWLFTAVIITGLCGLLYIVAQQGLRLGADDPQIQMAEDISEKLRTGQPLQSVLPPDKVDIASSLAPYVILFDTTGKPVASSGQLDGKMPTIPPGVFEYVRQNGEDRFTWQPQVGVRSAVVVTKFTGVSSGFVLAGRSLREVEKREDHSMMLILLGWIGLLFTISAVTVIFFRRNQNVTTSTQRQS
jgi:hypothetical protein